MLSTDLETFRVQIQIQRFAVVPLSPMSGLIGWVPQTDTLFSLIKEYRKLRNISVDMEEKAIYKVIHKCAYAKLSQAQKVCIYICACILCKMCFVCNALTCAYIC